MLTITSVLSLFTLLVFASGLFFIAKRLRIPYTVLLVLVGLLISMTNASAVYAWADAVLVSEKKQTATNARVDSPENLINVAVLQSDCI